MNIVTLNAGVTIPAGSLLNLGHEQAVAREGLLIPVDTKDREKAVAALAAAKLARANVKKNGAATLKEQDTADNKVATARAALAKVRGIWRAKDLVFFKGGEVIGFEGNPGASEVREALGLPDGSADAAATARADGVAEGRRQLLGEVEAYNAALDAAEGAETAVDEAEAALGKETDATKKPALEKALEAAKGVAADAVAAANRLKPTA